MIKCEQFIRGRRQEFKLKLTGIILIGLMSIGLASTIEIGSANLPSNQPWCGS